MTTNVDVIVALPVIVFTLTAVMPSEEVIKEIHTKPSRSPTLLLNKFPYGILCSVVQWLSRLDTESDKEECTHPLLSKSLHRF